MEQQVHNETLSTFCPDCGHFVEGDFIEHRERAHPPAAIAVAAEGIESEERHGYQPDPEE